MNYYPDNGVRFLREEHIQIQKKTFTMWINSRLNNSNLHVNNLFTDLTDIKWFKLYEILTGEHVKYNNGSNKYQRIDNIHQLLINLKKQIRLHSVEAEDIINGNRVSILTLLWEIILKWHIGTIETNVYDSTLKREIKNSGKAALLLWVQEKTQSYDGVNIIDFSVSSWQNGLGFNAIINSYKPDLFVFDSLKKMTPIEKLNHAFDVAEKEFQVPQMLDALDIEAFNTDEKSIMIYLATLYHSLEGLGKEKLEIYSTNDSATDHLSAEISTEISKNLPADLQEDIVETEENEIENTYEEFKYKIPQAEPDGVSELGIFDDEAKEQTDSQKNDYRIPLVEPDGLSEKITIEDQAKGEDDGIEEEEGHLNNNFEMKSDDDEEYYYKSLQVKPDVFSEIAMLRDETLDYIVRDQEDVGETENDQKDEDEGFEYKIPYTSPDGLSEITMAEDEDKDYIVEDDQTDADNQNFFDYEYKIPQAERDGLSEISITKDKDYVVKDRHESDDKTESDYKTENYLNDEDEDLEYKIPEVEPDGLSEITTFEDKAKDLLIEDCQQSNDEIELDDENENYQKDEEYKIPHSEPDGLSELEIDKVEDEKGRKNKDEFEYKIPQVEPDGLSEITMFTNQAKVVEDFQQSDDDQKDEDEGFEYKIPQVEPDGLSEITMLDGKEKGQKGDELNKIPEVVPNGHSEITIDQKEEERYDFESDQEEFDYKIPQIESDGLSEIVELEDQVKKKNFILEKQKICQRKNNESESDEIEDESELINIPQAEPDGLSEIIMHKNDRTASDMD